MFGRFDPIPTFFSPFGAASRCRALEGARHLVRSSFDAIDALWIRDGIYLLPFKQEWRASHMRTPKTRLQLCCKLGNARRGHVEGQRYDWFECPGDGLVLQWHAPAHPNSKRSSRDQPKSHGLLRVDDLVAGPSMRQFGARSRRRFDVGQGKQCNIA
ncbi:hypothetical protein VTK73DRAFT_3186 [Phialemonium thermophilum]|uniref:Uncharacterized protein n=1 Tax=Phialemonium thermophilum TaxID=223376 RepID=A0ABR3X064_9PEZI